MRTLALLVTLALFGTPLAKEEGKALPPSVSEKQEMLRTYLSTRVLNGRPAVPALVFLCPTVTDVPLDSAFAARRKSLLVLDELVAGDCSAIGRDIDSLSRRGTRQVLRVVSFDVSGQEATLSVQVFRVGGMHNELAHFRHDLGWGLDSLVLKGFFEI